MNIYTEGWSENDHLALAVSTGVDSMVLLHMLTTHYHHTYRQLTVLHVNHGIRSASLEEAAFLERYCQQHHIPLRTHELDLSALTNKGKSIQQDARQKRYAWFESEMKALGATVLLTAHHLDDQLETIFYRLMTGRSTRSRLGMQEVEERSGYRLVRPLLHTDKQAVKAYQAEYQVPYFEDASNQDNHYVRNDIRNRIFPAIDANDHLDTAQLLKLKAWHDEQFDLLHQAADDFIKQHVARESEMIQVDRTAFNRLSHSLKTIVLDQLLEAYVTGAPISEQAYQEWFAQIENSQSQAIIYATDKWNIQIVYDKFIIMGCTKNETAPQRITQPGYYDYGTYRIIVHDDIEGSDFPMVIRSRQSGDRFVLPNKEGHQKVNRLMINRKVPKFERERLPILLNKQGEIIAVGTLYTAADYEGKLEIINLGV
ncbi:tRNA lysidine(34) synthetase TilS [Staphylococcus simulans]|uniref:tRNA lysidine(34) synthetase TilS n=1 Tax=Staphylococcus simulans TaxID=1286 RepID=UPI0021CF4CA4|nr:tRNA lysidine(34) synthetase TilS [Staphylococcus simulans]UXR45058.1 tRNA lysidine(34) synthetase TilS [Staphylococcus simulans]